MRSLYSRLFTGLLAPGYDTLRGRRLTRIWKDLDRNQWKAPEEIARQQWEELQKLLRIAFETVPYYAVKYKGIGWEDIRSMADFRKLPPLTRGEVEEHREELKSSLVVREQLLRHATGGSSGQPVRFYITRHTYEWRTAATWRSYSFSGCQPGDRIAYLWGSPVGEPPRLKKAKSAAFDWLHGRLTIPTFTVTEEILGRVHKRLLSYRPLYLGGYTSSLVSYARHVQQQGLTPPRLRAILTAAEPCQGGQRAMLESVLGAPVYVTYGSREFMSIGVECSEHQGLHLSAENLVVEVEAPEGEPGEILVTDLHNYGTVFLRYRIGDIGVATSQQCPCGRGLPRLLSVQGRTGGVIEFADGRRLSGLLFFHLLKEFPTVIQFQVVQETTTHLAVNLLVRHSMSGEERSQLSAELTKYVGGNTFTIRECDRLQRSVSGKTPAVVTLAERDRLLGAGPKEADGGP